MSPDFFAISKATCVTAATLKVLYEERPQAEISDQTLEKTAAVANTESALVIALYDKGGWDKLIRGVQKFIVEARQIYENAKDIHVTIYSFGSGLREIFKGTLADEIPKQNWKYKTMKKSEKCGYGKMVQRFVTDTDPLIEKFAKVNFFLWTDCDAEYPKTELVEIKKALTDKW